jgi:CRP-like cAMP-binding protein
MPRLIAGLRSFAPLPDSQTEILRGAIREDLIEPGRRMNPRTIGFLLEGLLRAYYLDSAGRERTKTFWAENVLVYSLGATLPRPGQSTPDVLEDWTVEAIEPTRVFTLSLEALDRLYEGDPSWNHVGRVFWQHAYREKLIREREFLTLSATDRYREFTRLQPGLVDRIPQYMVASYLGITPVALSRLRGRRTKKRR